METYTELKARHSKELNDFQGIFFAFSNDQFEKGMTKVGLKPDETKSLFSLGSGGYILKTRSKAFSEMFKRHEKERKERNKEEKFLIQSLVYELSNHEYGYTGDPQDAIESIGFTIETIDKKVLKKAIKIHNETVLVY